MWQRFFLSLSLVVTLVLIYSLVWGEHGLGTYRSLQEHELGLKNRFQDLEEKNIAFSREIRLLQADDKYIENVIRQRFNFVKRNEILYIFDDRQQENLTGVVPNDRKN